MKFQFQLDNLWFLKIKFMLVKLQTNLLKLVCMMNFLRQILMIHNLVKNKITQQIKVKSNQLIQKKNLNKNKKLLLIQLVSNNLFMN